MTEIAPSVINLPTQTEPVKPWIKHLLVLMETRFKFSFLEISFVLSFHFLVSMQQAFPSFRCMPKWTQRGGIHWVSRKLGDCPGVRVLFYVYRTLATQTEWMLFEVHGCGILIVIDYLCFNMTENSTFAVIEEWKGLLIPDSLACCAFCRERDEALHGDDK